MSQNFLIQLQARQISLIGRNMERDMDGQNQGWNMRQALRIVDVPQSTCEVPNLFSNVRRWKLSGSKPALIRDDRPIFYALLTVFWRQKSERIVFGLSRKLVSPSFFSPRIFPTDPRFHPGLPPGSYSGPINVTLNLSACQFLSTLLKEHSAIWLSSFDLRKENGEH